MRKYSPHERRFRDRKVPAPVAVDDPPTPVVDAEKYRRAEADVVSAAERIADAIGQSARVDPPAKPEDTPVVQEPVVQEPEESEDDPSDDTPDSTTLDPSAPSPDPSAPSSRRREGRKNRRR